MPSFRALGTFALALAARPSDAFLTPSSGRTRQSYAVPARCGTSFCGRVQRTSSSAAAAGGRPRRTRGGAGGALMMAKKKAAGKKKGLNKGSSASGNSKAGRKMSTSGGVTTSTSSIGGEGGAGAGVAVADAPSSPSVPTAPGSSTAVAGGAPSDDADVETTLIENRVSDAESIDITPALSSIEASSEFTGSNGGKGFGAPAPQPKAVPKKSSSEMPRGGVPTAPQMEADQDGDSDPRALPPVIPSGTTQNPMSASAVPMDPSHRRVLPEGSGEVTEGTFDLDEGLEVVAQDGSEMTPIDMLRYLRENNIAVDLETMNPVEMPAGARAKMEATFLYPSAELMARRFLGPQPKPSEFVAAMMPLLPEDAPWDPKKTRPMPALKEFLIANRLHGGSRAMNVISSLMLKAMGQGDLERAKMLKGVGICVAKAEDAITGPFRQAVMLAENRLAPCMGSLACEDYAGEDGADAAGTWIVLKACVAEWELRLRQVRNEEVGLHDIFRAIPNPTDGLDEERTASITASVQAMGLAFSSNEKLIRSLPSELRFLEGALGLSTTTEVRRFALQEFCPKEGISAEELRFRMRSLICGLEQMPRRSYHQLQVAVSDVADCLMEGTPEAYNIYNDNWQQGENLSFDTYRVEADDKRRLRLREIITSPKSERKEKEDNPYDPLFKQILPKSLWKVAAIEAEPEKAPYVMVEKGWLDSLDYLDENLVQYRQLKKDSMRKVMPSLAPGEEGWDADPTDDIFTDSLNEEREMLMDLNLTDDDEIIAASGIRDGPGPGMRELDLGFDLPEEFEEMAVRMGQEDEDSSDTFISRV